MARGVGEHAGPPLAVKRLPATAIGSTIDLSAADSMMGQPFPPNVLIEARLDSDGDAATRDPNDAKAIQDNVATGSSVTLILK